MRKLTRVQGAVHLWLVAWLASGAGTHPLLAATYYVDVANGSNTNTPAQAQDPSSPWKNLSRALSAIELAPGDIIMVAAGAYNTGTGENFPLPIVNGVSVMGAGSSVTIVDGGSSSAVFEASDDVPDQAWIEGLSILDSDNSEATAFSLNGPDVIDLHLDSIRIDDSVSTGVEHQDGETEALSLNLEIENSSFDNSYTNILVNHVYVGSSSVAILLDGNTLRAQQHVLDVSQSSASSGASLDLVVNACSLHSEDGSQVIYSWQAYHGGVTSNTITLQNSSISSSSGYMDGLEMTQYSNSSQVMDVTLVDNGISDLDDGLYLWQYNAGSGSDLNLTFANNTVSNLSGVAVSASVSSMYSISANITADIRDNEFTDIDGDGIYFGFWDHYYGSTRTDATISGNTFTNLSGQAIEAYLSSMSSHNLDSSLRIEDNVMTSIGSDGIYLGHYTLDESEGTIETTIRGNTLSHVDGFAMYLSNYSLQGNDAIELRDYILDNHISNSIVGIGIYDYSLNSNDAITRDALLVGNTLSTLSEHGIDVYASSLSDNNGVSDAQGAQDDGALGLHLSWTLYNNTLSNIDSNGIAISVSSLSGNDGGSLDVLVAGNTISNISDDGIYINISSWYDSQAEQRITVSGNTISGSGGDGISISLSDQTSLISNEVDIQDNYILNSGGNGLYADTADYAGTPVMVSGNSIIGADYGIRIYDYPGGSSPSCDLGGGSRGSVGRNSFLNLDEVAISYYMYVGESAPMQATGNYFGTVDREEVEDRITDASDDYGYGFVEVGNLLSSMPTVAASATLTTEIIDNTALPGTNTGDTLRYTATLTGTGEIGCASGWFHAGMSGVRYVGGSAGTSKGMILNVDDEAIEVPIQWLAAGETVTITWDVEVTEDLSCGPVMAQGVLSCHQLGDITTDDPTVEGDDDPLSVDRAKYIFFADEDGDGYGDAFNTVTTCLPGYTPPGATSNNDDCNDDREDIYPGATETCDGVDNDCDDSTDEGVGATWYADADDDGYGDPGSSSRACTRPQGSVADGRDCNDSNDDINPAEAEVCDGVDNNCNESIDEGVGTSWYEDSDDDGYGDTESSAVACTQPSGYVLTNGDCNDDNDDIHPGAAEVCDGADNDCDGTSDVGVGEAWYEDGDGDGVGDSDEVTFSCARPGGSVPVNGDCNDSDDEIYPGADEACDGKDNDCDGDTDEEGDTAWFRDDDGDGYGTPDSYVVACSPAGYVNNASDCDDTSDAVSPAATEVCDSIDNDCNGLIDDADGCNPDDSPTPPTDVEVEGGGCGCNTRSSEGTGSLWLGFLLFGFVLRRRRRSGSV